MSSRPRRAAAGPPAPDSAADAATITDVSYRSYDGELRTRALRWWTITVATIRAGINRKRTGYWIPAAIIVLIYLFQGIQHYLTQGFREQAERINPMFPAASYNPYAMTLFSANTATGLLVFIAALTVGSATIAADNRANALLVYLARPISRADYLFGKWMGVFLMLAALTVAPALLLFLFFAVAYNDQGFLTANGSLLWRLLVVTSLGAAINASLVIGFSAWARSPRVAGALYAAFYFIVSILTAAAGQALASARPGAAPRPAAAAVLSHASVDGVLSGVAMNLYDVSPQQQMARMEAALRRRRHRHPFGNNTSSSSSNDSSSSSSAGEGGDDGPPSLRSHLPERPPLTPMLAIAAALMLLPVAAAAVRVRAVEIVRG